MTQQTSTSNVTASAETAKDAYCTSGSSPTNPVDVSAEPAVARAFFRPEASPTRNISYEIHGDPTLPTIVVLGGISAGRHVCSSANDAREGWWEEIVGPKRAIDTNQYSVLGVDWLGGPNCEIGWLSSVTTDHQAVAIAQLLEDLKIETLEAIVGSSYGGMVALAFAARFPSRVRRVVAISAAHRTHPMATALRSLQRRIVRFAQRAGEKSEGLAIARGIAMTTYRTAEEFADRFGVDATWKDGVQFPVEAYFENRGRVFSEVFEEGAFVRLSESVDLHRVDPSSLLPPLTLVGVESDTLVPPWLIQELADNVAGRCELHTISSQFGHDAFLKETSAISDIVSSTLVQPQTTVDAQATNAV